MWFNEKCSWPFGGKSGRRSHDSEAHNPMGMGRGGFSGCDRNSGSDTACSCSVLAGAVWWEVSAGGGDGRWVRAPHGFDAGAHFPGRRFYDSGAAAVHPDYSRETLIVSSLVGEIVVRLRAGDWTFSGGDEFHHQHQGKQSNRDDHAFCDSVSVFSAL